MSHFAGSMSRLLGSGLWSIACAVAYLLKGMFYRVMPVDLFPPAIALSDPCAVNGARITKGDVARPQFMFSLPRHLLLYAVIITTLLPVMPASATIINNTARLTYSAGTATASVNVDAAIRTNSSVELFQYAPGTPGATSVTVMNSEYSTSGSPTGPFSASTAANDLNNNVINTPAALEVLPVTAIKSGEPIFIRLSDGDQNVNPTVAESIVLRVTSSQGNDSVMLRLTETGPNTGVFTGYVQTTRNPAAAGDEFLSVATDDSLTVSYTDATDSSDSINDTVLVDPYGILFSTSDGTPLDGAIITLVDVNTGQPATVYGDDGISTFPATITSGGTATDSNGNVYSFPPGRYRFPFVTPGNYQLYVIPPNGFVVPSTVTTTAIQSLPGAPYAIVNGSRGENFVINPGPAVHIDIPLDPSNAGLFVTKHAVKDKAAPGEFVQYQLTLSNLSAGGLTGVALTDVLPTGFRLEPGSVQINNTPAADPAVSSDGRTMRFRIGALAAADTLNINYVAAVGIGAKPGDAINTASATADGGLVSNTANARVIVEDDLMASRSFIMGRVIVGSCKADPADEGRVSVRMQSHAVMDEVQHRVSLNVNNVPVNNLSVIVNLPEVSEFKPGSAKLNGMPINDPVDSGNQLQFNLKDKTTIGQHILVFTTRSRNDVYGEFTIRAHARFYPQGQSQDNGDSAQLTPAASNRFKDFPRSYRTRFDSLSAELSQRDRDNITDLMHILRKQDIRQVTIVGHADKRKIRAASRHKFRNNQELSLARARAVATFLKQQFKLSDRQIVTAGAGVSKPVYYSEKLQGGVLSPEEQLSLNRRVEIFIELADQLADTRFIVSQPDSGIKSVKTFGPEGELSPPGLGVNEPGAQGVRLYLEDGRYVDTDKQGLFHFEGVRPGTHVVQIDEASLPDHLQIYRCENNTRFAGTPYSQFVDVPAGGMWRADFHVRKKPDVKSHGKASLQLSSKLNGNEIDYTAVIEGSTVHFLDRRLQLKLPQGVQYVHDSAKRNGQPINNPVINNGLVDFKLDETSDKSWQETITFTAMTRLGIEGEYTTSAALRFRTTDGEIHASPQAINSALYQSRTRTRQIFEAGYQDKEAELSDADRADLEGVIDFLLDKQIRKIRVVGHTDNRPVPEYLRDRYADNKALSLDRATKVAAYIARKLGVYSRQMEVIGMGARKPRASNDSTAGRRANRRTEVYVSYGDSGGEKELVINRSNSGVLAMGVNTDVAITANRPLKAADESGGADRARHGIVSINDGQHISKRIQAVRIRMDARLIPVLTIDGKEIPKKRIGVTVREKDSGTNLYSYIGVDLGADPGPHRIALRGMGPFGNARFKQDITYVRTGDISEIRMVSAKGNVADGKSPVRIRIQLLDESGAPVNAETPLSIIDGNLKRRNDDSTADKLGELSLLRKSVDTVLVDKDGYIEFEPVSQSGHYHATLGYNGLTVEVSSYVTPKYRDWIMVGLAEGSAGYNAVSGNMENLDAADIADKFYADGRLAFYAKGKVKGKYLLTAAYNSAKETPQISGNGLFGTIDPDKYYTLYGDNTTVRYDAPSSEKLYVKLESNEFYALFGDYETGLTVTELSRYSRSLTGLKSEYRSERVNVTAFAAQTDHGFVKDELRGDGTSGLYHLSQGNIVLNSEKVRIESRDRFKSEVVIRSRQLTRYIDYTLDPVDGTIHFREPVYSRDENFNPVYIVVDYEVESNVGNAITTGGRAAFRPTKNGPEIGATIIQDNTAGAEGNIFGSDIRYQVSPNTDIRAELATSSNNSAGINQDGNAGLFEITHQSAKLNSNIYLRRQDAGFGLGQQKGSETGTRKYGADVSSKIRDNVTLDAEYAHQENLNTDANRELLSSRVQVQSDGYSVSGGVRMARDTFSNGTQQTANLVTGAATRELFDGRANARVAAEVGTSDNTDYPDRLQLGADYALTESTQLFAQQEFTFGESEDTQMTRAGIKASPWHNANAYSTVENQHSEYGPRTFANMGLTQGVDLTEHWRLDFGLERSQTLREATSMPLNVNVPPASGSASDDFTALSLGAAYKNTLWSMSGRADFRRGNLEDKRTVLFGLYHEPQPGFALASSLKYFDTDRSNGTRSTQTNLEFSLASRPTTSQWMILDKIRVVHEEVSGSDTVTTGKFINSLNANYLYDRRNQVAFNHGIKFVKDQFDSGSYSGTTQLFGTEYRHDINAHWDVSAQASLLLTDVGDSERYSYGLSAGHSFANNVWLSVGFNFAGFRDDDFSAAKYTSKGFYVKFRFAFDQATLREGLAWWEKRQK
ncbi:MAG: OmpA family protein [Gammaproteobacteria bacterium]|jgi:uncharacterized repeat protein (TIGR01451 family)